MITIRHSLSPETLTAAIARLRASFERAGMDLDSMDVRFEYKGEETSTFSEKIHELGISTAALQANLDPGITLKSTPWERANPNAPWYRRLQHRGRR